MERKQQNVQPFAERSADIIRLARLCRSGVPSSWEWLRSQFDGTRSYGERAVLGLLLMYADRRRAEDLLLAHLERGPRGLTEPRCLARLLVSPQELIPAGAEKDPVVLWRDAIMGLDSHWVSLTFWPAHEAPPRHPYGDRGCYTTKDVAVGKGEWGDWTMPNYWLSPHAAPEFQRLVLSEDYIIKYDAALYWLGYTAAKGDRGVARWLADHGQQFIEKGAGHWCAILGGIHAQLGRGPCVELTVKRILSPDSDASAERHLYEIGNLTRDLQVSCGKEGWSAVIDVYTQISDPAYREAILRDALPLNCFRFRGFETIQNSQVADWVQREAVSGASGGIREAAMQAVAEGCVPDTDAIRDVLCQGLIDSEWNVRRLAVQGIRRLRIIHAEPELSRLLEACESEEDRALVRDAIETLRGGADVQGPSAR